MIDPLLDEMEKDTGDRPVLGSGYFVRNPKYGAAVKNMLESAPMMDRMHLAQMALWLDERWASEQRHRYFALIADAKANSRGGHQYGQFWNDIAEQALQHVPESNHARFEALLETTQPRTFAETITPEGPGRAWTLEQALEWASKIGARQTYFTHISHQLGFHDSVNAELPDGVALAYDGLVGTAHGVGLD